MKLTAHLQLVLVLPVSGTVHPLYIHCASIVHPLPHIQGVRRENFKFNTLEIIDWNNRMLNRLQKWKDLKKIGLVKVLSGLRNCWIPANTATGTEDNY